MKTIEIGPLKQIAISDVARELGIDVKKNKAMCFNGHDRKTPSLTFDSKKNLYYCFGCGAGGDTIKLVEQCLKFNFKEACHWLSSKFGYLSNLTPIMHQSERGAFNARSKNNLSIHSEQEKYCHDSEVYEWLINSCSLNNIACDYLIKQRGISRKTLEHFNIKDIEKPFDKFIEARKIWGIEKLLKCGLAKVNVNNRLGFIWWNHVILLPFYNMDNRIVYIQGRQVGDKDPKYVNLKGVKTEIFNLKLLSSLKKGRVIHICEGVTDVLSAYEVGLNAVGILGANGFKDEWAYRFTDYRIRVIPDVDVAGEKFVDSIEKAFSKIGQSVQIVRLDKGKDFSEFIKTINK